jgi:hypothetical protein
MVNIVTPFVAAGVSVQMSSSREAKLSRMNAPSRDAPEDPPSPPHGTRDSKQSLLHFF